MPPHYRTGQVTRRAAGGYGWLSDAFGAACEVFDTPEMSSAAALLGGAARIIFTGAGPGVDAAAFGASAFNESGFDAVSCHAGDLRTGSMQYQPGDLIVGFDSESQTVAGVMRRARNAGLHTIGVTTRDLTIVDADVLLYVPASAPDDGLPAASILACCLTLGLLAARIEPGSVFASEVARVERDAHRVTSASGRVMASIVFSPRGDQRIVIGGKGVANWAASSIARRLNRAGAAPPAVQADLHDIAEGSWPFNPADMLIAIDPYETAPGPNQTSFSPGGAPESHRVWTFTPQPANAPQNIHLPSRSPALGALIAYAALVALIEFAGNSTVPTS